MHGQLKVKFKNKFASCVLLFMDNITVFFVLILREFGH